MKVRLVCESGDLAFMFNGRSAGEDGLVQFNLPIMRDKLKEGLYQSRVEVLIENRYFAPVQFQVNFKKAVTVMAEAVKLAPRKATPEVTVSAVPVIKPKSTKVPTAQKAPVDRSVTLKEGYRSKKAPLVMAAGEPDEDAILALARSFVNDSRKK